MARRPSQGHWGQKILKSPTGAQRFALTKLQKRMESRFRVYSSQACFPICEVRIGLDNSRALTVLVVPACRPRGRGGEREREVGSRNTQKQQGSQVRPAKDPQSRRGPTAISVSTWVRVGSNSSKSRGQGQGPS